MPGRVPGIFVLVGVLNQFAEEGGSELCNIPLYGFFDEAGNKAGRIFSRPDVAVYVPEQIDGHLAHCKAFSAQKDRQMRIAGLNSAHEIHCGYAIAFQPPIYQGAANVHV